MQAVKAEDVGTAQRLLQRPRPGKASECGGRGRAGATAGAGPPTPPGARRRGWGGDAVGSPGAGRGQQRPDPLSAPPPPVPEEGRHRAPGRPPSPRAGTWPRASPSLPRLRADSWRALLDRQRARRMPPPPSPPWREGGGPGSEGRPQGCRFLSDPLPAPCLITRFAGNGGQDHAGGVAAQAWPAGGHLLMGEQRPKVAQPRAGCAPGRCRPCHGPWSPLASLLGKGLERGGWGYH